MSLQRYLSIRRSLFIMTLGLVIFVSYLYFFVGAKEIFGVFQSISYPEFFLFYSLSILASLLSIFFYSASWQQLLKALSIKVDLKKTFQYHAAGYFVDLVIPCQTLCGEVTRVYFVYNEAKENYGRIFATASVNRILNNSFGIIILSIGALLILQTPQLLPVYILGPFALVIIGIIVYNAIIILVATRRKAAERFFTRFLGFLEKITFNRFRMENSLRKIQESLQNFESGFKMLGRKPQYLLLPIFLLSLAWISSILSFALVFYALNVRSLSFSFFLTAFTLFILISGAGATLSVGILDIVMTNFFILHGVATGASGVAMLLIRIVVFWIPIFFGYMMIEWLGARSLISSQNTREKLQVEVSH